MAKMLISLFVVLSVLVCRNYSMVVINNVTMSSDTLSELFINEIRNNQDLIDYSVPEYKAYNAARCMLALREIVKQFPALKALRFFDAWGKFPSGILKGNLFDIGNFDQCIRTSVTLSRLTGVVNGQYCFASIPIIQENRLDMSKLRDAPALEMRAGILDYFKIYLGICVPDTCSPQLLTNVFELSLNKTFNGAISGVFVDGCTDAKKPQYRAIDIVGITFFSLIAALMVLSSIYDFLMGFFKKSPKPILLAFSIITNGRKLFAINTKKSPNTIDCLIGIRVFSMLWVLYGHTFASTFIIPMVNTIDILSWLKQASSMHVINATVSVDSFFFLSGVLVAWMGFRELDRRKGKLNVIMMYVHRYIRLTPALAAVILFAFSVNKFIGTGPMRQIIIDAEPCDGYNWWASLLYIQNYYVSKQGAMCFPLSWYLAIDFQLYILSPLLLIPMWKWGKKFAPVLVLLSLLSIGCVLATFITEGFTDLKGIENREEWEKTYIPTHTRYSPWLVGFGLGYFMHISRGKTFRLSKLVQLLGWIACFVIIVSILFAPYFTISTFGYGSVFETAMYEALKRVSWAIALAWITFTSYFGFGGVVDSFLSHPFWQPLGRLTYALYLVHIPVMQLNFSMMRTEVFFSNYTEIQLFWQSFGISLLVAIPLSLAFESPVLVLEKFLFGRGKQQPHPHADLQTETVGQSVENEVADKKA